MSLTTSLNLFCCVKKKKKSVNSPVDKAKQPFQFHFDGHLGLRIKKIESGVLAISEPTLLYADGYHYF